MVATCDLPAPVGSTTTPRPRAACHATLLDPNTRAQAETAGLKLLSWPVDWSGLLLFDREGKVVPALKELKVRQAINYALDRESLLKNVMQGSGTLTSQVFGPESGSYLPELDKYYSFDVAKAKSLMAEAGYVRGNLDAGVG